ncbi:hypothetical protein EG327_009736, partial [Venturia inaequalis]
AFALVLFVLLASVRDALSLHVVALFSDANRAAEFLKVRSTNPLSPKEEEESTG